MLLSQYRHPETKQAGESVWTEGIVLFNLATLKQCKEHFNNQFIMKDNRIIAC